MGEAKGMMIIIFRLIGLWLGIGLVGWFVHDVIGETLGNMIILLSFIPMLLAGALLIAFATSAGKGLFSKQVDEFDVRRGIRKGTNRNTGINTDTENGNSNYGHNPSMSRVDKNKFDSSINISSKSSGEKESIFETLGMKPKNYEYDDDGYNEYGETKKQVHKDYWLRWLVAGAIFLVIMLITN